MTTWFAFVCSFVLSAASLAMMLPLLSRILQDHPNERSSHANSVPRGGGVAVALGVSFTLALILVREGGAPPATLLFLWCGALAVCALGLLDDFGGLSPLLRLIVTTSIAVTFVIHIVGAEWSRAGLIAGATIFMAGYINAFNFMDGVNGISALNGAVACGWFALLADWHGMSDAKVLAVTLAAGCLGFLPFNAPRARVFLGDAGSYLLGFALGAMACWLVLDGIRLPLVMAPLWPYLTDTSVTLLKRILRRRSPFEAHREHVYQVLLQRGVSHIWSAGAVTGFGLAACLLAVITNPGPYYLIALVAVALSSAYVGLPRLIDAFGSVGSRA